MSVGVVHGRSTVGDKTKLQWEEGEVQTDGSVAACDGALMYRRHQAASERPIFCARMLSMVVFRCRVRGGQLRCGVDGP